MCYEKRTRFFIEYLSDSSIIENTNSLPTDEFTKYAHVHYWVGWLVVVRINVDLAIFQPYLDLEAGDNQSLKIQVAMSACRESNPGPLAPQAKSLTTQPPLLPFITG